ncbi:MAG: DegT/DnrJ/EryC1/StrS family aminotransferase [Candidatus Aureabacteria bacterium]|nr:DegT/DnrJ/EryC1/StrS family aminotransferase [Candidatus Auribacterota bacterium]
MIPFVDVVQQYTLYRKEFKKAFEDVCSSGMFVLGPEVQRFEKRFCAYLGVKEAVGVASGTDALRLACQALGIGPGDEVLVPANTFIATALSVYDLGSIPVPVDVNPESFLMDLTDASSRLTGRTKAILPVHLYGRSMDMDAVTAFSRKHNLILIEDACQAHGAMWEGRRVGSFGAVGCFSFYPGKNLGAFGDGGMIVTEDHSVAEKLRLLRNYGSIKKYIHEFPGTNSRLDSLQAAILNIKIKFLDEWNKKRFYAARRYTEKLKNINGLHLPVLDFDNISRHVFHLFVLTCERRDELLDYLTKQDIGCGVHYPVPIHLHRAFTSLGYKKGSCPVAEQLSEKIISLPMFPEITDKQIDTVAGAVRRFYD